MSDETKPDRPPMPPQPPTTRLPAMTDRALLEDLHRVTRGMATEVQKVSQAQNTLEEKVDGLVIDVADIQRWRKETEYRQNKHSGGVKQLSETDRSHAATQAAILTTQVDHAGQLADQTVILKEHTEAHGVTNSRLDKVESKVDTVLSETKAQTAIIKTVAEHPMVKKVALGAIILLGLIISVLTAMMRNKLADIEHKPAQVQPAPTVYIQVPVRSDGGTP